MDLRKITLIFTLSITFSKVAISESNNEKLYLTFPKGTTLSAQICMTYQLGVTPGSIFTQAVNWGINYPLEIKDEMMMANDTEVPGEMLLRRERRNIFQKFEKIIFSMGYDGRHCILRALCEFKSISRTQSDTLENELLKIFFEYTTEKLTSFENKDDVLYHEAQKRGESNDSKNCFQYYPRCHFSLIDLLFGNYDFRNFM